MSPPDSADRLVAPVELGRKLAQAAVFGIGANRRILVRREIAPPRREVGIATRLARSAAFYRHPQ